jgi:prepilin-type N-terminal cleavage/methylation domain-containing protein
VEFVMTTKIKKQFGFTLLEVLIVIAIIGLLSSIVAAAVGKARVSGKNGKRITDMRALYNALDLYYDKYGYYPPNEIDLPTSPRAEASGPTPFAPTIAYSFISALQTAGITSKSFHDPEKGFAYSYIDAQNYQVNTISPNTALSTWCLDVRRSPPGVLVLFRLEGTVKIDSSFIYPDILNIGYYCMYLRSDTIVPGTH